ncbi:DUF6907 domain-containing protein [Actinomyces glycerinitolerans]|nr:hypothetical protein [Actinomyces glycerinitolerans]
MSTRLNGRYLKVYRLMSIVDGHGEALVMGANPAPKLPGVICPEWCTADHQIQSPDDLLHEAPALAVPCVQIQRARGDGSPARSAVPAKLSVVQYQYHGDTETWVYIGDGFSGLDLSLESARRLAAALGSYLTHHN